MAKKLKWNLILMSVLYLGLGIFLLMRPSTALNVVCYALGGVVLVCAAVQLVRYFAVERGIFQSQLTLISGIICLGLGAFLILRSDIVVRILPIVFGLFVIFDSLGRIQNALDLRRCEYPSWKGFLLLPVLSVVLGVVMILNPFGTMETLVMAIGIILIIEGAINLLSALYTVLAIRRFSKLHPETIRTLLSDIGQRLGGDAVMTALTRTAACGYPLQECLTFEQVAAAMADGTLEEHLLPTDSLFSSYPKLRLNAAQERMFCNGVKLDLNRLRNLQPDQDIYTVYGATGTFLGTALADRTQQELRIGKRF